jgi:hypothetical protein
VLLLPQLLLHMMHTCIPVILQAFERSEVIIVCHFVGEKFIILSKNQQRAGAGGAAAATVSVQTSSSFDRRKKPFPRY